MRGCEDGEFFFNSHFELNQQGKFRNEKIKRFISLLHKYFN